jgi:hypothetical protein
MPAGHLAGAGSPWPRLLSAYFPRVESLLVAVLVTVIVAKPPEAARQACWPLFA